MNIDRYSDATRRVNLDKLATYLENLPADYAYFNMSVFLEENEDYTALTDYALNNGGVHKCGTAACAVGHGPSAGILFDENEFVEEERWDSFGNPSMVNVPNWNEYSKRFVDPSADDFEFMFGGGWSCWDDTPAGAAKRIRYYLVHGIPDEFHKDFDFKAAMKIVDAFAEEAVA